MSELRLYASSGTSSGAGLVCPSDVTALAGRALSPALRSSALLLEVAFVAEISVATALVLAVVAVKFSWHGVNAIVLMLASTGSVLV